MENFITKILCCLSRLGRAKLEQTNKRTGKLMTIHPALNPKKCVVRIHLSRKEKGRGPTGVKDTVNMVILGLERYVLTSEEGLLAAATRVDGDYEQHLEMVESLKEFKERRRKERSNILKQKKLRGQFFNQTEDVARGRKNGYG